MKLAVLLLIILVSIQLISAASFYQSFSTTAAGLTAPSYIEWRNYAWSRTNSNGVCAHLATYETNFEFQQIINSVLGNSDLAGDFSIYLAAVKDDHSNTFYWAVGSRRGQPFFSATFLAIEPFHNNRFLDINFESGFICHQEFCFDREHFKGIKFDSETNAVLIRYSTTNSAFEVVGDYTSVANFGVLEYESLATFANAEGGSKFIVSKPFHTFTDANYESNLAGTYIGRIDSEKQQQWILDELQCTTELLWIGYQRDQATNNIVKAPGPGQGQTVYDSNTGCVNDLYCNYSPTTKRSILEVPGLAPSYGIALDLSQGGKWVEVDTQVTTARYLRQAEFCSINADQFFRHNFELGVKIRTCKPNPTNTWVGSLNRVDGNFGYFTGEMFFAGGGVFFTNPDNGAEKLLYFDCNCDTNPIIDKACLGSRNFPDCSLYTNNGLYYELGLYSQRLMDGLAYSFRRLKEYYYWNFLYNYA